MGQGSQGVVGVWGKYDKNRVMQEVSVLQVHVQNTVVEPADVDVLTAHRP